MPRHESCNEHIDISFYHSSYQRIHYVYSFSHILYPLLKVVLLLFQSKTPGRTFHVAPLWFGATVIRRLATHRV